MNGGNAQIQAPYKLVEIEQTNGLRIHFATTGLEGLELPVEVQIQLYRIVQEAVGNIRGYSRATRAEIRLVSSYPHLVLRVEDRGRGFSVPLVLRRAATESESLVGRGEGTSRSPGSGP